jgi:hypothetical protein
LIHIKRRGEAARDWETRRITTTGKGGKRVTCPITSTIHEIL